MIEYMTNATEASDLEIFSEMIGQERQLLHTAFQETASAEKEAVKREFALRLDAEKKELPKESDKTKKEAPKANEAWGGLDLTSFVTGYSFEDLAKYREMIETHPVEYEQNAALIDALQAFLRGKEFSAPAKLLLKQMGHPME